MLRNYVNGQLLYGIDISDKADNRYHQSIYFILIFFPLLMAWKKKFWGLSFKSGFQIFLFDRVGGPLVWGLFALCWDLIALYRDRWIALGMVQLY